MYPRASGEAPDKGLGPGTDSVLEMDGQRVVVTVVSALASPHYTCKDYLVKEALSQTPAILRVGGSPAEVAWGTSLGVAPEMYAQVD